MRISTNKERLSPAVLQGRLQDFRAECRRRGLRMTAQRLAVYRALAEDLTHPSAERLWQRLRPGMPSLSQATVYRILESLEKEFLIRRVSTTGAVARFDANVGPHQHLVCRVCGRMADVAVPGFPASGPPAALPELAGFVPEGIDVRILGRCATCRTAT